MNRATLFAILRIAILCCAPFGVHTQLAQAAISDPELTGAAYQSFLRRRLIEMATDRRVPPQEFLRSLPKERLTETS